MPDNIKNNQYNTDDYGINTPLFADFQNLSLVIPNKISDVRQNPHPDTGTECCIKAELKDIHFAEAGRK